MNESIKKSSTFKKGIAPIKLLPLGFFTIVCFGTLLLMLPCASNAEPLGFFDALFTATSASCVTGLIVVDTGTYFTLFGQIVIILLIQIGGLGFMTVTSFLFTALGRRISLRERMTIAESFGEDRLQGMVRLVRRAIIYTFSIELAGIVLLSIRFIPQYGFAQGLWRAVFHSISAFCNAGFDLMGGYSSLTAYVADPLVNFTVMALIILGGLGFAVLHDITHTRRFDGLRLHTKVVLYTYFILLAGGTVLFLLFEYSNTLSGMPFFEKLLAALFQSVTCRTAGFNTIDQAALRETSKVLSSVLMLIGGSPAGTAGGIKVTTIALLFLTVRALMRNRADTEVFGRRINTRTVRRALCIFLLGITLLFIASFAISLSMPQFGMIDIVYETASAIGTVGLSVGISAALTPLAQAILCAYMFIGRVGMLTFVLAIGGTDNDTGITYPEGNIMVG